MASNGKGDFPIKSGWVTPENLRKNTFWGSNNSVVSTVMNDWFWGAGSTTTSKLKRWDGATWVEDTMKRWDGANWVAATLKRWDGATWTTV